MSDLVLPNINKILVIRNDGIGDLLNSTPAITLLRNNYPRAEICVLTQPLNAPVLTGNPHINRILIFDRDGAHREVRDRIRFYGDLRREEFDVAIALRTASWSNFVTLLSGARYRLGRYHKRLKRTLTHRWHGKYEKGYVHEVDRNLELIRLICAGEGNRELVFNLLDQEVSFAKRQLMDWRVHSNDFLVCLHPGGSSFDKQWPSENFAHIADWLVSEFNAKILILQGPNEAHLSRNVKKLMTSPSISHAPESIRNLAALMKHCNLVICNDSGPMHIAAALDVPMVAIFGPTDHVAWKPLSEKAAIVRRDMPCWPCSAHKCKIGWECTKKLPLNFVRDEIARRVGGHLGTSAEKMSASVV
ncbi:MAG: lipopolysaccharide heptosyltransferase II [Candidatus Poribacteria bacterium]|nr:lipopolysaccharide heptosyltransferase II [Candidatus Poribacteria bacterium]MDE0505407.1 lipopolysaccharide heptosyltransferase II [Candidatus Poribacteria bacterium]